LVRQNAERPRPRWLGRPSASESGSIAAIDGQAGCRLGRKGALLGTPTAVSSTRLVFDPSSSDPCQEMRRLVSRDSRRHAACSDRAEPAAGNFSRRLLFARAEEKPSISVPRQRHVNADTLPLVENGERHMRAGRPTRTPPRRCGRPCPGWRCPISPLAIPRGCVLIGSPQRPNAELLSVANRVAGRAGGRKMKGDHAWLAAWIYPGLRLHAPTMGGQMTIPSAARTSCSRRSARVSASSSSDVAIPSRSNSGETPAHHVGPGPSSRPHATSYRGLHA